MKEFTMLRSAGVPLAVIESADPAETIRDCVNSMGEPGKDEVPVLEHDIVRGLRGVNKAGSSAFDDLNVDPTTTINPAECFGMVADKINTTKVLDDAVIFMHSANRTIDNESVCQAIWNVRDPAKAKHVTLIMLAPAITLPSELKQDVVVISEALPDEKKIEAVCKSIISDAGMKASVFTDVKQKVIDTLRGLSAFAVEQCISMSLTENGIDMMELIKLKRSYVSQLPGVEVREDKITFADIAGYDAVKTAVQRKIKGKRPPRLILWLDEIERAFAGNAGDTSGTSADQTATVLTWMQDRLNEDRLSATMFVGFPGVSKSAVSMAARNEAQCECLRLDMGGMKDSLVGSSEKRIRNVLKVVDAMSGGHILVIASCNSMTGLPAPLISRFAFGVWFFDLPGKEEGEAIWKIKRKKYGIDKDQPNPTTDQWTGREIQQCCFLADDLQIPLSEAARCITPFCATSKVEIDALRRQAHNRFLSASAGGFYTMPSSAQADAPTGRKFGV